MRLQKLKKPRLAASGSCLRPATIGWREVLVFLHDAAIFGNPQTLLKLGEAHEHKHAPEAGTQKHLLWGAVVFFEDYWEV